MSKEFTQDLFSQAVDFHVRAQELGLDKMTTLRQDGAVRLTDFPLTVESPNASLIIAPDGSVVSGHNIEEVNRIFGQLQVSLVVKG